MTLKDFQTVQTATDQFPTTNALQGRLADAMRRGEPHEGVDGLLSALAYAVLDFEVTLAESRATHFRLQAYVLELEARLLNAGVELDEPPNEL